jgi:hypothetical protein
VIQHEVGHIFRLGHAQPVLNEPCPIMVQQTKGIGKALPNFWPTDLEKQLAKTFFIQFGLSRFKKIG